MPIYPYRCQDCKNQFDVFSRNFEVKEEHCPHCGSKNTKRLLTIPLIIRMGKSSEPTSEVLAKDEVIDYYKNKGRPDLAAKEAEKAGKNDLEVKQIREEKSLQKEDSQ